MKFIRLDYDRNFLGTNHKSSFTGDGEHFENGISCYEINKNNVVEAINDLCKYWFEIASTCDFSNFDINIFEGSKIIGNGSDYEDLAICTNNDNIITLDGSLFDVVYDLYYQHQTYLNYQDDEEMLEDEDYITTEEFNKKITEMFIKYL